MTLGIDIDDTITNSSDIFIKYATIYNIEKNINHRININELNQDKAFGWIEDNKLEFRNKYLKKILSETKPKNNAIEVINKLKDKGYKICFITARNKDEISSIYNLTYNWLMENNIKFDKLIVNSTNKLKDCIVNNVDIFIDDNYSNCNNIFENLKIPVFMFNTRYNSKHLNLKFERVFDWNEIYVKLEKINMEKSMRKKENNNLDFIDADRREDFPLEPKGFRYIYFYGGTKNYRAYLVPENLSRADFMEQYPQYIPEQNIPIYENNGIILRADPKFPCPGFYILSLNKTYKAFDLIDDVTFLRFSFILKKAKEGMRKVLKLNYAHLLSNEKSDPYVNVHFWLVPINGITSPDLLDFNVKEYLNSFVPKDEINKIISYNKKLKKYFEEINLVEQDNKLTEKLLIEK